MSLINQPNILSGEFAAEGDKNTIPDNNDGLSGLASIAKGFPPITQQSLSSGGLPPQRADFNGIFNLFSKFLMYIQSGGIFEYSNTLDYQPPAIVWGNNNFYKCIQANGQSTSAGIQPLTNTQYWELLTPLKNISVSNNVITVTDGENEEDTFTIDTLQAAPSANDNSNKIPTTSWVQTWVNSFVVPAGIILPFAGGTIPPGYLACNGAAVSRTTYNTLFNAIGTTYGAGDGSTTFNLPTLEDNRFLEFSSARGTQKSAGLPNITGSFRSIYLLGGTETNYTGAFYSGQAGGTSWDNAGSGSLVDCKGIFEASRSSNIYGISETVQPKSLTVRAIIKY